MTSPTSISISSKIRPTSRKKEKNAPRSDAEGGGKSIGCRKTQSWRPKRMEQSPITSNDPQYYQPNNRLLMRYQSAHSPFLIYAHDPPVLLCYNSFLLLFLLLQLSMDLQFVQIEHRQNVLKLMQICGLEMKQAYQLYIDCGYNFEAAVNRQFNPLPPQPQNAFPPYQPAANAFQQEEVPIINNQFYDDDDDYKYSQFKRFMANGKPFDKKYPVRRHETFFSRIIPKFFKGDEDDPFKKNLERCIDKRINLKNTTGNLSEVLEWSWKEKYPALIMILDFAPATKQDLKKIFTDDPFVEQVLNQQFKVYGIHALEYELQEQLKIFFNLQRDVNHFIVCRVNHLEEVQVLHRIKISQPYEQFKKKLKLVKSQCIQLEMEESNIVKQYQQERRGNFNYKRPRTVKENIKYKEDKKIRQQQEQQFFKACLPKKEEKPERQQKPEKKQQEKKPQKKVQKQEQLSQQKVKKTRQSKFASLKRYSSGIGFKIRLPSGNNIVINVDPEETVQYLFDYISNQPSDLGFADELKRQFDIFVGFGGSMRLRGKQGEQLKTLFQDSQVLIVRQTAE